MIERSNLTAQNPFKFTPPDATRPYVLVRDASGAIVNWRKGDTQLRVASLMHTLALLYPGKRVCVEETEPANPQHPLPTEVPPNEVVE